jgi:hypothetical protein
LPLCRNVIIKEQKMPVLKFVFVFVQMLQTFFKTLRKNSKYSSKGLLSYICHVSYVSARFKILSHAKSGVMLDYQKLSGLSNLHHC